MEFIYPFKLDRIISKYLIIEIFKYLPRKHALQQLYDSSKKSRSFLIKLKSILERSLSDLHLSEGKIKVIRATNLASLAKTNQTFEPIALSIQSFQELDQARMLPYCIRIEGLCLNDLDYDALGIKQCEEFMSSHEIKFLSINYERSWAPQRTFFDLKYFSHITSLHGKMNSFEQLDRLIITQGSKLERLSLDLQDFQLQTNNSPLFSLPSLQKLVFKNLQSDKQATIDKIATRCSKETKIQIQNLIFQRDFFSFEQFLRLKKLYNVSINTVSLKEQTFLGLSTSRIIIETVCTNAKRLILNMIPTILNNIINTTNDNWSQTDIVGTLIEFTYNIDSIRQDRQADELIIMVLITNEQTLRKVSVTYTKSDKFSNSNLNEFLSPIIQKKVQDLNLKSLKHLKLISSDSKLFDTFALMKNKLKLQTLEVSAFHHQKFYNNIDSTSLRCLKLIGTTINQSVLNKLLLNFKLIKKLAIEMDDFNPVELRHDKLEKVTYIVGKLNVQAHQNHLDKVLTVHIKQLPLLKTLKLCSAKKIDGNVNDFIQVFFERYQIDFDTIKNDEKMSITMTKRRH